VGLPILEAVKRDQGGNPKGITEKGKTLKKGENGIPLSASFAKK